MVLSYKVYFVCSVIFHGLVSLHLDVLTESRRTLQPKGTWWFPRIGLFGVQAISLGPFRGPIEFLTSLHPCRCLSKIPNLQIQKVEKWKILSPLHQKDFFVISYKHKEKFFVVIWPTRTLGQIFRLTQKQSDRSRALLEHQNFENWL